jgi:hypothetical protein
MLAFLALVTLVLKKAIEWRSGDVGRHAA